MKKLLICMLALALLLGGNALTVDVGSRLKVVNCNEYITLREEPSTSANALARIPLNAGVDMVDWATEDFWLVSYKGQVGYALSGYLREVEDYSGRPVDLTRDQRYNLNLFLSNFTEQGFMWSGCYDSGSIDAALLTRFAVDH